ncbi:MAG: SDR family oxidoreductase [Halobacteriales archaeon]
MRQGTVIVTGASSGIGRATAGRFHDEGWRVYATARDTDDIEDLADRGMETIRLDVTDDEQVEEAVSAVEDDGDGVDCLVNNAGVGVLAAVEDLSADELHRQMDVNLYGPQRLMRRVLPGMRERGEGTVVNVSSVSGRVSTPGMGAYCASKHALEALSDAARAEVDGFGVDVVLVEPGPVETPFGDKSADEIDRRSRSEGAYDDLYDALEEYGRGISGGRGSTREKLFSGLSVKPEKVADVVYRAASSSDPKPRYSPSSSHRGLAMTEYLPSKVRDRFYDIVM